MKNKNIIKRILIALGILLFVILVALAIMISNVPDSKPVSVSPAILKSTLKEGEKMQQDLVLTSLLDRDVILTSSLIGISGNLQKEIKLAPRELRHVTLEAFAPGYGTFVGEAQFSDNLGKSSSLVVIDSETSSSDFDATVEPVILPSEFIPGGKATFVMTLFNIKGTGTEDLYLEYSLISSTGAVLSRESEKASISTGSWLKVSLSRAISIPVNAAPGRYIFAIRMASKSSSSSASTVFEIGEVTGPAISAIIPFCQGKGLSCSLLGIIVLIIAFFVGGYSYYYLGVAIRHKIHSKEPSKPDAELVVLFFIAFVASFILYQVSSKSGIISNIFGSSSGIFKVVIVLVLIFALLELIRHKGHFIVSLFKPRRHLKHNQRAVINHKKHHYQIKKAKRR